MDNDIAKTTSDSQSTEHTKPKEDESLSSLPSFVTRSRRGVPYDTNPFSYFGIKTFTPSEKLDLLNKLVASQNSLNLTAVALRKNLLTLIVIIILICRRRHEVF